MTTAEQQELIGDATYSPEDNKLRIYPAARLDSETFARVKAAGYKWAPRQELFVAPRWTPARADLAEELCGEIGDEDTSLTDRADERAGRFEDYSANRLRDAESAQRAVSAIADNIPMGQPILVGHHSEKHARRDAKKIENGMRRAVKMWETSRYWTDRAAGAIRHAKYKERPDVRLRRIKGLDADRRKLVRAYTPDPKQPAMLQEPIYCPACNDYACREHPEARERVPHVWCGAGRGGHWVSTSALPAIEAYNKRWIAHIDLRLAYERAMLGDYEEPKKVKPIMNYRAASGSIIVRNPWQRGEVEAVAQHETTKAEWSKIPTDYKGTRVSADGSHRVRYCMERYLTGRGHSYAAAYLKDGKDHGEPTPVEPEPTPEPEPLASYTPETFVHVNPAPAAEPSPFEAMRDTLESGGVQVVTAPQLFPTPVHVAERMIGLADIEPGMNVLEPSAGTGTLVGAIGGRCFGPGETTGSITAVEINAALCDQLRVDFPLTTVINTDFLELERGPVYDRIVMNPPFRNSVDIKHIRHALGMLAEGGRLVAICANGPRQHAQLQPIADSWEELPEGTFAGTGVRSVLMTINK